jgi:hypothetical protein
MPAGLAMALLGAVALSGKAVIVKPAYRHGVDATALLMLRILLIPLKCSRYTQRDQPRSKKAQLRAGPRLVGSRL